MRLTERSVKTLKSRAKAWIAWDDGVKGFGVRVNPSGVKAFVLDYRIRRRHRRMKLGDANAWTVTGAREYARELQVQISKGTDPLAEKQKADAAPTVNDLWRRYEADFLPGMAKGTRYDARKYAQLWFLPRLGKKALAEVTHSDIERLHKAYSKKAPYAANRCVELLRRLFNLAIKWGWCSSNPAAGIEFNRENARQTYLTKQEVQWLLEELGAENRNREGADLLRFLILTGCRCGEALALTWEQVDLDAGVWTKPAHAVKARREHRVPLSDEALAVLRTRKQHGERVFGSRAGVVSRDVRKTLWSACERASVRRVRIHDLRHTYASLLASEGVTLPVIGALLDHSNPQTTARYAHLYDDALRAATAKVGKLVR